MPEEIANHASVRNHVRRLGARPSQMLLDKSYHYAAMKRLRDTGKRGRPDIVHIALMEALSTPLFLNNLMRVYVHTLNDKIIAIADNLRIPKSYFRFEGLMMNLFRDGTIKSDDGSVLIELADATFKDLLQKVKPEKVIGLSSAGVKSTAENVAANSATGQSCAFVVGGFPRGHFSESTTRYLGPVYSISAERLESHVVIARLVYECEKILLEKRVNHEGNEKRSKVGA